MENASLIKEVRQRLLKVWGSVSDENRQLSKFIMDKIMENMRSQPYENKRISENYNTKYVSNTFELVLPPYKEVAYKKITIKYLIYETESEEESNFMFHKLRINGNCSWSEDTSTMTIITTVINGEPSSDFLESVIHETNHLFEYSLGMKKNEKLYEKMAQIIEKSKNEKQYYIALALYYTFKHERNSFVQQFYQFLLTKKTLDEDFWELIFEFKPWEYFHKAVDNAYLYRNKEEAIKTIEFLGFNDESYYRRLDNAYDRFYRKLANVYFRRKTELDRENLKGESIIRHSIYKTMTQIELSEGKTYEEKLKNLIPYGTEFFYEIN